MSSLNDINADKIRTDLSSKIPLVRQQAAQNLKALITQQRRLLDPEDSRLRELVMLLNGAAVKREGGKLVAVVYSEQDGNAREGLRRTLNGISTAERVAIQNALKEAGQTLDTARRAASGNQVK